MCCLEVFVKKHIVIASAFKCRTPKLGATDEKNSCAFKGFKKDQKSRIFLKIFRRVRLTYPVYIYISLYGAILVTSCFRSRFFLPCFVLLLQERHAQGRLRDDHPAALYSNLPLQPGEATRERENRQQNKKAWLWFIWVSGKQYII